MSRARGRSARPIWSVVVLLGLAGCTGQPRHETGNLADFQRGLGNPSREARIRAVAALTDAGLAGIPGLVAALASDDAVVRWRAARALGRTGPLAAEAARRLGTLVAHDPDRGVRIVAADALGAIGEDARAAIRGLAEALEDRDPDLRSSAALALGHVGAGEPAAVSALVARLRDPDADVRASAAAALRDIGPEAREATPALVAALDDARPLVRRLAGEALRRIHTE